MGDDITKNTVAQNLYIHPNGDAWFGNGEKGLLKYDFEKNEISKLQDTQIGLTDNFISSLYSPDNRFLYIGNRNGVSVLDMATNKTKHYPILDEAIKQLNYLPIRSLYKDDQNRIWLGTEHGLLIINEKTGAFQSFTVDSNNPKSISDNTVNHIYEDSKGDIWLATFQGLDKVISVSTLL